MKTSARRLAIIAITILVLILGFVFLGPQKELLPSAPLRSSLEVSTTTITAKQYSLGSTALAQAKIVWKTEIISTIEGQILPASRSFQPGTIVAKGTILAKIDPVTYQTALAEAESAVAQAELVLQREQLEREVVMLGSPKPETPYARREPQIAAAEATLKANKAQRDQALKMVQRTKLRAPFDAVVLENRFSPGQWVTAGEPLLVLGSAKAMHLELMMSVKQTNTLFPLQKEDSFAALMPSGVQQALKFAYLSPLLDHNTHQQKLVLELPIKSGHPLPLADGQALRVQLPLRIYRKVFSAPHSAITKNLEIFHLSKDNRLQKQFVQIINRGETESSFRLVAGDSSLLRLVRYPLPSFIVGQKVQPLASLGGDTP